MSTPGFEFGPARVSEFNRFKRYRCDIMGTGVLHEHELSGPPLIVLFLLFGSRVFDELTSSDVQGSKNMTSRIAKIEARSFHCCVSCYH